MLFSREKTYDEVKAAIDATKPSEQEIAQATEWQLQDLADRIKRWEFHCDRWGDYLSIRVKHTDRRSSESQAFRERKFLKAVSLAGASTISLRRGYESQCYYVDQYLKRWIIAYKDDEIVFGAGGSIPNDKRTDDRTGYTLQTPFGLGEIVYQQILTAIGTGP